MRIEDLKNYGHNINDNCGNLKDVSEVIIELKEILTGFSTHSMNEFGLILQGQKKMLSAIIEYLERI